MGLEPFIGEIILFAGNFAPRGWALCDGQLLNINQNDALFAIIGTTYGGDGRTTFGLPDLRGRVAVHPGTGPGLTRRRLGERGGEEEHDLNLAELPPHSHPASATARCSSQTGTSDSPADAYWASSKEGDLPYRSNQNSTLAEDAVGVSVRDAGGGRPHNNMQPYTGLNYIIALVGVFPSRA